MRVQIISIALRIICAQKVCLVSKKPKKFGTGEQTVELNREQIIKALDCCTNCICNHAETDTECPLVKMSFCKNYLMKQSLSLINELTEENKAWQMQLIDKEEKADKAYYELACEVEDLRAENERSRDTAYRLECEVHRERANTVRKMQERLHERKVSYGNITFRVVPIDDIDQIAKEMLEGIE